MKDMLYVSSSRTAIILVVWPILCIIHSKGQKIPFDEQDRLYGVRASQHNSPVSTNQNYPTRRPGENYDSIGQRRVFSNGTYMTDGNITEFYSPDVYGPGTPRRGTGIDISSRGSAGFGPLPPNPDYRSSQGEQVTQDRNYGSDYAGGHAINPIGPIQNKNPYDDRSRSNKNPYSENEQQRNDQRDRPLDTFQNANIRRENSGSYRNANPPPPNVPYGSNTNINTNYNYNFPASDIYPKSIPNYTDFATNPRRNYEDMRDDRRNSNYEGGRSNYGSGNPEGGLGNTGGNSYQSQGQGYPGSSERNFQGIQSQQPNTNFYPGPVGGGSRNWNYQAGRGSFDPGDPNRNLWNEPWSTTTIRPIAPGVLGGWRSYLQGKQRQDDLHKIPETVFVTTSYGRVQGFKVRLYDGPGVPLSIRPGASQIDRVQAVISSFVGIPYAKPPLNDARFRPPRPHQGWQIHQAIEFGPACPQPDRFFGYTAGIIQVNEDCLYLNVYSPDVGSGVEGSPFPVIFYIHDGDFIHGGSQTFPPHQLVAWHKVVVVTVNFRLGALGFLSTADEFSPGNYGMLDLALALKWVHSTIRSFNGDPERITLVGLGSGAAAAGLLMLSPKTRGFVRNVVALEGAPTADWAAINDKYRLQNTTQLFSLKLGCWNQWDTTSWSMVQCLRSRSWQEIGNWELDPDVGTFPWSPAVDRTFKVPINSPEPEWSEENWRFLPDTPENILRQGEYPYVKYMTGSSRQAAGDLLYENKTLSPNFVVTREWFDQMIHRWVKKYNYTLNPEGVYSAIRYAYTYWPDPMNTTHLRDEYIQFLSDALYRAPIDQTVKLLLARGIQVHSYLLNYTLEGLRLPEWRETTRNLEYYLLAGAPFMDSEFIPERIRVDRSTWTEGDRNMSQFLMGAVANMANYGSPTPREILGIYWERATPADLKYLAINGTNNSTMQRNYRQRELTFWTEYMPFVVGRFVPTYPPTTEYWWEPNEPLQIAFWSVSGICLILIVGLVACCLLWRTAKKQRDRVYQDYGPANRPLGIGPLIGGGDELLSEYAASVKTADSLDSGVKLSHNPNPRMESMPLFLQPQIHTNPGAVSQATLASRDKYPVPRRSIRTPDSSQTQV